MRARAVAVALAGLLAVACGGGDQDAGAVLDREPGEGFALAPAPRLDVIGLGEPIAIDDPACVASYEVHGAGRGADGSLRYLATMTLTASPATSAELAGALGEDTCVAEREAIVADVIGALGAVGPETLEVSYRGADGRRWLLE